MTPLGTDGLDTAHITEWCVRSKSASVCTGPVAYQSGLATDDGVSVDALRLGHFRLLIGGAGGSRHVLLLAGSLPRRRIRGGRGEVRVEFWDGQAVKDRTAMPPASSPSRVPRISSYAPRVSL